MCCLQSHGPSFGVPTGRRDGRISSLTLANDLPDVNDPIEVLKSKFHAKGLSTKDLVLLTAGAHTIGTSACFFMPQRLYNFNGHNDTDPSINPKFLQRLKLICPLGGSSFQRLHLDWSSQFQFDDHILRNILNGFAVLASDAQLVEDGTTKRFLQSYAGGYGIGKSSFGKDFAAAMVRMTNIQPKTGPNGEIRKACHKVNS
ncbi:unnamed protein product [Linum tenue]|uniref:peroxidase n=1 Tax=Linum tenue TaxID=586396 RepID=A0AAV0RXI6_9ROSI|nr:unnamed protein product [Linum tenue]